MHASFPYESNRGSEYGGVRRPDVLIQSHPGLDPQDPLVLHNALSAVDDGQVSPHSLSLTQYYMLDVPEGKVSFLGGQNIGYSKQKCVYVHVPYSERFPRQLFHCTVHCTDQQHAMSSHELQSAVMLTVEFSKMYYTR
jgi:hypothetical protein